MQAEDSIRLRGGAEAVLLLLPPAPPLPELRTLRVGAARGLGLRLALSEAPAIVSGSDTLNARSKAFGLIGVGLRKRFCPVLFLPVFFKAVFVAF